MSGKSKDAGLVKTSFPIELLPTDLARIVSQAHPAALLSAYYLRFPAFVADPVATLLSSLLPLAIIQMAYAVICLPVAGSSVKAVFFALILSVISVPVLATTQVLFGAPLTTHLPHTLLSSAHIALLAIFPLMYVQGSDGQKWKEIASLYSPIDEVFGAFLGCFLGAWLGAVPIPLDWDREWQKWPVTIVTGAYIGYLIGKLVGRRLLKGQTIEFD